MSNNIFNIRGEEAGREWARNNPKAIGVQIDDAATAYCPLDPVRRHFQQGAYDMLNRLNTQIYYRWSVQCRCGRSSGGMANTSKEAQELIKDTIELYRDQGREPVSFRVYDRDDTCIIAMDTF